MSKRYRIRLKDSESGGGVKCRDERFSNRTEKEKEVSGTMRRER